MLGVPLMRGFGSLAFRRPAGAAGDTTAPTITSVSLVSQTYNPYLHRLCGISLKVDFSEEMDTTTGYGVTASLTIGGVSKTATNSAFIGQSLYLFYIFDGSEKGSISVSSPLVLASGTLKDLAGNNCTLTFTPPDTSALIAVMRGVVWATDFSQGANAQVLYGAARNVTVSASTGQRGSTTGSDTEDPTWGADGAQFASDQRFVDIGSNGEFDFLGKPASSAWSFHCRCKPTWDGTSNGHILFENGANVRFWWAANYGEFSFYFTCNGTSHSIFYLGTTTNFKTISVVADGAGNVSFYVNGTFNSTITSANNSTSTAKANINYSPVYGAGSWIAARACTNRALYICNVAHDATEVANAHTFLSSLAS